jgi:predicted nucleotide-binding protein (sugar kinase/HSP70/actin superfamily)
MTKFNADTVDAFMKAAYAKFGGNKLGETEHKAAVKYAFRGGKLTNVTFTCPITAVYAEVGSGKPDAPNKDAIAKVAKLAQDHENKHKSGYDAAFKTFDATKSAKDLMAKTYKDENEAKKALAAKFKELTDALMAACLKLHQSEGLIIVTKNGDKFDVTTKPAGSSGCK